MRQMTLFDISPDEIVREYTRGYKELLGTEYLSDIFPLVIEDGVSSYYLLHFDHFPDVVKLVSVFKATYAKTHWIGEGVKLHG